MAPSLCLRMILGLRRILLHRGTWLTLLALQLAAPLTLVAKEPARETRRANRRGQERDTTEQARQDMVRNYLESAGITDARVLDSMRTTPRHEFLPISKRNQAYYDMAIPIGEGQTISPPYIVAFMTEQLHPEPTDRVLEIGTGSGYQAAVLSPLVEDVYTIEIQRPLGERAAVALRKLDYKNVHPRIGDGYLGWPEKAPFHKIIVTCSPEKIPQPLVDQLAEGGLIVIPVGERFQQTLCRFRKVNGKMERETLQATFFVPMTGESETQREVRQDDGLPRLVNGSFEQPLADGSNLPLGWYYVREGTREATDQAPDGGHVFAFQNDIAGRSAHALQSFGVDGRVVRQLDVTARVRTEQVERGGDASQRAVIQFEFYGEQRNAVGQAMMGPWQGTKDWHKAAEQIAVPPTARLAVVGIGLFGATGRLSLDDLKIEPIRRREEPTRVNPLREPAKP